VQQVHLTLLHTFSETQPAVAALNSNSTLSFRDQLQNALCAYETEKSKYETLFKRVQTLKTEAFCLFEALEVSDDEKGEWTNFDVKFSETKVQSLEILVKSLTIYYTIRQNAILHANKKIATFRAELVIEIPNAIVNICPTNSLKHSSISDVTGGLTTQTLFEQNAADLRNLAILNEKMEPVFGLIQQREVILSELVLNSKALPKNGDPKEDQRKRRLKTLLPRLEKSLMTVPIEFREINGFNAGFIHVILSDIEIKTIRGKARKKSLPEYAVQSLYHPRKSLENLRNSGNAV
jgi:hypothetical protein